jgi:glycosyltransferase involved in cell wall biosynthesis
MPMLGYATCQPARNSSQYQLYAPFLARYDRVIVFSKLQADILIKLGVPAKTLSVIPNGVDTARWSPAGPSSNALLQKNVRQRLGGERIFLYMGRLVTEKNVEALLRAWRLVSPEGCRLVVVGDGPLTSNLQNQFSDPQILWWGYEPDLDTRIALLQCAEVFLLPSLVEGLSLALLEAMATGTACVATDAGADGEVLAGGAGIVMSTQGVTTQLRTLLPVLRDQPVLTAELAGGPAKGPSSATRSAPTLMRLKSCIAIYSTTSGSPPSH